MIAGVITIYEAAQRPSQSTTESGRYQAANLDLKDRSIVRGESRHSARTKPPALQPKPLDLTIFLPISSEAGTYQVQLVNKIDEPVAKAEGKARIEHENTILRISIDLTHFAFGPVLIGV